MRTDEGTAAEQTQPLIGRARERARLLALVARARLVGVVGAAGVGKSALVRACLPHAHVISLADVRDEAELAARTASAAGAPVVVWDDVPDDWSARVFAHAAAWSGGALIVVARAVPAEWPTVAIEALADDDARALVAALDAAEPLLAGIAAGGNPAAIVRRLAAARAAVAPVDAGALAALCAGRLGDALDGDPLIAAAALCGLDALDRAATLLRTHAHHPRAPLVALALAWRRGELRACLERGAPLMATLDEAGDALGHAVAAAIVARAAFGLGEIERAEALLRTVDGFVASRALPALAAFGELGRVLVAAFRGDWEAARRHVARAHELAPASTLCAVERVWAEGCAPPAPLDDGAAALHDLRLAEGALAAGRLDDGNRHARDAERRWRDAGADYDRALALLARTEALVRAGDGAAAAKLRQACGALADHGGYRIVATALYLLDAFAADRDGELPGYIAALARARAVGGAELHGGALARACLRVALPPRGVVADGQPMRDRLLRLGLVRAADRLWSVGRALWLRADDDAPPAADVVADADEHTLTAGGREQRLAPQLMTMLEAIAEAGGDGLTPEALYHAVWQPRDAYHPLRHRNAIYVAVNRLRVALEPVAGTDALRSTSTHYALAPGLRVAVCRAVRRLAVAGFARRDGAALDARAYARRHGLCEAQARWELALHAAERG